MFDFLHPGMTEGVINQYEAVYEAFAAVLTDKDRVSRVPHAPYTVSPKLFDHLRQSNPANSIISIHNQETPAENELFVSGTGHSEIFIQALASTYLLFRQMAKPASITPLNTWTPTKPPFLYTIPPLRPKTSKRPMNGVPGYFGLPAPMPICTLKTDCHIIRFSLTVAKNNHRYRFTYLQLAAIGLGRNSHHKTVQLVAATGRW